jgi:hypothetical protein
VRSRVVPSFGIGLLDYEASRDCSVKDEWVGSDVTPEACVAYHVTAYTVRVSEASPGKPAYVRGVISKTWMLTGRAGVQHSLRQRHRTTCDLAHLFEVAVDCQGLVAESQIAGDCDTLVAQHSYA